MPESFPEMAEINRPVVSAPMAAAAGGELAAAVSSAGGLGLIGGGYGDRAWLQEQFRLAGGARVGCGFITWSLARQPELLDVALERDPVAVMLSFGDPAEFASRVLEAGALLLCQVQNCEQAERALDAGASAVVAQGCEAGGHGREPRTTFTLVPEIADLVEQRGSTAAVLAAGGIADGRGLAAARALGASAAVVGSRFYAAREALSTEPARQRIQLATGDDTCRTRIYDLVRGHDWPGGEAMSVLRNDFTDRWCGAERDLAEQLPEQTEHYRDAVARADYDTANVTTGQATGLIGSTRPAGELVAEMAAQADSLLR